MTPQANPDADRLAAILRQLAADPRDLEALISAGRLSARLGDTSAALAFFARAEAISPGDPRIPAGRASALVRLERPGEALKLFRTAEAWGLRAAAYAADRGLAYDLLGQPTMAQQDYRLALGIERDDETVRRLALSLGITGDTDAAMRELDPLLRRSDRAAWRARAFILAMNGDVAGAERIASNMLPGAMGQSLAPFFRRLPNLSPSERAFAVHFGSLSPTPARIADAQLAPELPRYVPAPKPLPQPVAQAAPQPQGRDRRSRRDRERDAAAAIAAARQPVTPTPTPAPLPPPPQYVAQREIVQPIPAPAQFPPAESRAPVPAPAEQRPAEPRPVQLASASPSFPVSRFTVPAAGPTPTSAATTSAAPPVSTPAPTPAPTPTPPPAPAAAAPTPAPGDTSLASIVENITIPADELAALNAPAPEPAVSPEPTPVRAAATAPAKPKPEAKKPAKAEAKPVKKPEPKKPDPAKTDPARVWVQVAGGANEASLPKAWKGVVSKAPAAMKGKSAWWTPLRATNRLLAGPFKSSGEAQAFVNTLGKSGVSAFVFTSEAGQKITKLAVN